MKGKFNKEGVLYIERAGIMKEMFCKGSDTSFCADYCPLMGEPQKSKTMNITFLKICENRELQFEEFTDERKTT